MKGEPNQLLFLDYMYQREKFFGDLKRIEVGIKPIKQTWVFPMGSAFSTSHAGRKGVSMS
jgi:hypothetical protein